MPSESSESRPALLRKEGSPTSGLKGNQSGYERSASTSRRVNRRVLFESLSPIIPVGAAVQTPSFRTSRNMPSSDSRMRSVFPCSVRMNSTSRCTGSIARAPRRSLPAPRASAGRSNQMAEPSPRSRRVRDRGFHDRPSRDRDALPDPGPRAPGRARGARRARRLADRLRQDACVRDPKRRAH
jgi:hypothetical protein